MPGRSTRSARSTPATSAPALTRFSPAGGCGCKMPQDALGDVLASLAGNGVASAEPAALLVGLTQPDDAAVLDITGLASESLVVTCDFQTPVVDDPTDWGRIAAVNALSDVYAMGGTPVLALNLLCWPADLDPTLMTEVLHGGAAAVAEAGAVLAGGHSITDPAPKYGLAVIGHVPRERMLLKGGARAGDRIVLTKALGAGVVGTAIKRGEASPAQIQTAVEVMTRSNANASAAAVAAGLRGATDVTGFGLIGHLHEMANAAGLAARIWPARVPTLPGVADLVDRGCAPDGSRRTLANAVTGGWFRTDHLPATQQLLLADAQTSGGLLLAVPPEKVTGLVAELRRRGDHAAAEVGEFVAGDPGLVVAADPDPGGTDRHG